MKHFLLRSERKEKKDMFVAILGGIEWNDYFRYHQSIIVFNIKLLIKVTYMFLD